MNLPSAFVSHLKQHVADAHMVLDALHALPITSVRVNTNKTHSNFTYTHLKPVSWADKVGYYLQKRPAFTFDPYFQSGFYYVQEAGSMFIGEIIKTLGLNKDAVCGLDLCAAPGGKSTHMLNILNSESVLVANEIIKTRTPILNENLVKWGLPNYLITQSDAKYFGELSAIFDFILCDAPCSGEGMIRKNKEALHNWSIDNIHLCAQRQKRIVKEVWPSLKENGYFIYATCTFNVIENEENIVYFTETLQAESVRLSVQCGITETVLTNKFGKPIYGYRLMPGLLEAEGLFVAVLQKSDARTQSIKSKKTFDLNTKFFNDWLPQPLTNINNAWVATHDLKNAIIEKLTPKVNIWSYGPTVLNQYIQPLPALANLTGFKTDAIQNVYLNYADSIRYLQGHTKFDTPPIDDGYVVMTYDATFKAILGFAKKTNNRFNNLFPKNQYIKTQPNPNNLVEMECNIFPFVNS